MPQPDFPLISRRTFVGVAAAAIARAQQDTTFSTDVKVISVLASVRDKNGRIVNDLAKDDFDLSEDGRPQKIAYFSRETDLPLTLGLLVDTSGSQRTVLGEEKSASYRFVEHVIREDRDRAFVLHFDTEVELLQDVTPSRQLLEKAIGQVDMAQMRRNDQNGGNYPDNGGGYPGGSRRGGGMQRGGGTTLYDAILLACNEIMAKQKERKAVIVLSDGVDRGSRTSLNSAIDAAQRADTLVYSILFKAEEPSMMSPGFGGMGGRRGGGMGRYPQQQSGPDGKKILQQISHETGGGFFEVSKKLTVDQIYDRIEEDLRNQYSIGYTSDKTEAYGFRRIALTAKQKNLVVQARSGYFPQ